MRRNVTFLNGLRTIWCFAVSFLVLISPGTSEAWYTASNSGATLGHDMASALAVTADSVIVVGYDYAPGNNSQWRIEKRNKATGALVTGFGTGGVITANHSTGSDEVTDVALGSDGFYVVGYDSSPGNFQWRAEKRDITTGALVTTWGTNGVVTVNPSIGKDLPHRVVVGSDSVYIGGESAGRWRVEKRSLTTGSLIAGFGVGGVLTIDHSAYADGLVDMQVDSTQLYLAGYDSNTSYVVPQWRFGAWNTTTGANVWQTTMDMDEIQYADGSWPVKLWMDTNFLYLYGSGVDGNGQTTSVAFVYTKSGLPQYTTIDTTYRGPSGGFALDTLRSAIFTSDMTYPSATAVTIQKRKLNLAWTAETYTGENLGTYAFYIANSVSDSSGMYLCGQIYNGSRYMFYVQFIALPAPYCTSPRYPAGWQSWTDATITAGTTKIRKAHIDELRTNVNLMRADAGLAACSWTDPVITAGVTKIRKAHFDELRSCIAEVYTTCGQAAPIWTDPVVTAGATKRRKIHLDELRTVTANAP